MILVQQFVVGCGAELQVTEFNSVALAAPRRPWRVTANCRLTHSVTAEIRRASRLAAAVPHHVVPAVPAGLQSSCPPVLLSCCPPVLPPSYGTTAGRAGGSAVLGTISGWPATLSAPFTFGRFVSTALML